MQYFASFGSNCTANMKQLNVRDISTRTARLFDEANSFTFLLIALRTVHKHTKNDARVVCYSWKRRTYVFPKRIVMRVT